MNKVLVIDDEEGLRQVVRAALGASGFEVIEAADGKKGLELARSQQPNLILCDVHMDGMTGYEVLESLHKESTTTSIPVILMTGVMKDYSSVRHAMEIGADDYLMKPFSVDDLITAVNVRLEKNQMLVRKAESRLTELRYNIALSLPHELRTPLVSILGFADLLKSYSDTMERGEIQAMAIDIHLAATRLHGLIENFLIYAQIELMGVDQRKMNVLRREQTTKVQQYVKTLAQQKANEFKRTKDLDLELVDGAAAVSSEYLVKMVAGLLDNAFKFSREGTRVKVQCSTTPGWFNLTIADKGRGMSPDQIENVGGYMQFERKMYEQQGSGLGLIIAKRLAEVHGGTFTIQSEEGKGTTVTVRLPAG